MWSSTARSNRIATKEDIQALRADIFKWGLTFFVPMWLAVLALVIDVVVR